MPIWNRANAVAKLFAAELDANEVLPNEVERFASSLSVGELGTIRLARLITSSATLARNAELVGAACNRAYTFLLQVRGRGGFCHYGCSISLDEGDLTLCDSGAPYNLTLETDAEVLMLRVPASLLKEHLPTPESFCGRLLAGSEGLTATAAAMALSLFDQLEAGLALHYQSRVARHLLDMVATAYAVAFETTTTGSSIVIGRHAAVKRYIEQHLRDPDLSPCSIASRLNLSSRYLRMIFATNNETVSAYILRRRLEECARQIGDPTWRGHSMTEIAFGWGFNSAPHFTRSFRDRYDMSPRDYRRSKLDGPESVFRRAAPATSTIVAAQAA